MKKLFLFAAMLLVSFSMKAVGFKLTIQNANASDINKRSIDITESIADLYGDGTVSVEVDKTNYYIGLTLNNANLTSTGSVIDFDGHLGGGDDNFYLHIKFKGNCTFEAPAAPVIALRKCDVRIDGDEGAVLNLNGHNYIVQLQNNAYLTFGYRYNQPFTVNITTDSYNAIFMGEPSKNQEEGLYFYNTNVNIIRTGGNGRVASNLEYIYTNGKISDGIVIDGDEHDITFKKNGEVYEGSMSITAPMLLAVGSTFVCADDDLSDIKSKNLKKGKISYDKSTKTMTLDGVELGDRIYCGFDGFTIYLKGDNTLNNPGSDARFDFRGDNCKITGDEDATVTFYCGGNCAAVSTLGALEISGIRQMTTYAAKHGIVCGVKDGTDDVLKLGVPMEINCADADETDTYVPVKGFTDVQISNSELELTDYSVVNYNPKYDKTQRMFINQNDNSKVTYIKYEYPVYLTFYGSPVNYKNMNDIKIEGSEGKASYDRDAKVLTLNGFKNTSSEPVNAIYADKEDLMIKLLGENEILSTDNAIETSDYDIRIKGSGTLKATSLYASAIRVPATKSVTIKETTVEAIGYYGLSISTLPSCMPGEGPEDYQLDGDVAALTIDNATLIAKTTEAEEYYGAIYGFQAPTLTNAELVEPEGARFAYECNWSDALCGVVLNNQYAREVKIQKTGAAGIEQTNEKMNKCENVKILRDGQLYLIYKGQMYDVQGKIVK